MANGYFPRERDKLQEIERRLHECHLTYLEINESPEKLKQRNKLEGIIKEYLCLVPHLMKYSVRCTPEIMRRSAETVKTFSGYRAAMAWRAISLYAVNLVTQPWRKEYRTLRTYSGYYKHEIETNLIGAEQMFEEMGYKHVDFGVLVLEGPVDPDKVTSVSRDALIAFVECQILTQIWEAVSQEYSISWLEILEFREKQAGTPEQAIRALKHHFYNEKVRIIPTTYRTIATAQPSYYFDDGGPPENCRFYHIPYHHGYHMMENYCNVHECIPPENKYYGGLHVGPPVASYATRVPTAKLIELDSPISHYESKTSKRVPHKCSNVDEVDYHHYNKPLDKDHYDSSSTDKKYKSPDSDSYNYWSFVHNDLEKIGYSKDLGDREDVLYRESSKYTKHKSKSSSKDDDKIPLIPPERKKTHSDYLEQKESMTNGKNHHHNSLTRKKHHSSYSLSDANKAASFDELVSSERSRASKATTSSKESQRMNAEEEIKLANDIKKIEMMENKRHLDRWSCEACTFLNSLDKGICEMCGKSKKRTEEKPLASGSKECPKCTLINDKNVSKCIACDSLLKDCPTYI